MSFTVSDLIQLAVIFVLIWFVGFFTSSETAYISLSRVKLRRLQETGKKSARTVIKTSAAEYLFSAERIPISTPTTEAVRIEKKARRRVVGNFGKRTSKTGLPD